jgi:uncharacterized cupin superfamily protein
MGGGETGDWGRETGDWRLETGGARLGTGDARLETGDWRRETGDFSLAAEGTEFTKVLFVWGRASLFGVGVFE